MAYVTATRLVHAPDRPAERLPWFDLDLPAVPAHDIFQVEIALDDGRIVVYETSWLPFVGSFGHDDLPGIVDAIAEQMRPDFSEIVARREMADECGVGWESIR